MKRKRTPYKPAIEGGEKGTVVSAARARWKSRHVGLNDNMIRMVRFVWMRQPFDWKDRHKLHAGVLGACMRAGVIWANGNLMLAKDYRGLR